MMTKALMCIVLPMLLTHFLYRLVDRNGRIAKAVSEKLPSVIKHKYLFQLGGAFGFVLVFGIICIVAGIPATVFYIVSGSVVGLVNGFSATLMIHS